MERHEYQFELWEQCDQHCKFCYLGNKTNITPDDIKIKNIQSTIDKISDDTLFEKINCLAYIGGEFFQGQLKNQKVRKLFYELVRITNELIEKNKIFQVWFSAILTKQNQDDLYEVLKLINNPDKIWLLTSYDTIGRFYTKKSEQIWKNNIIKLKNKIANININITSILTADFIQKYLDKQLKIIDFAKKYNCSMFWKPPCAIGKFKELDHRKSKEETNKYIPNFFPTRSKFLEFLIEYKKRESYFMYDKLFNIKYRSEYLATYGSRFNESHRIKNSFQESFDDNIPILKCGHSTQYQIYLDSDECAICDKNRILQLGE